MMRKKIAHTFYMHF